MHQSQSRSRTSPSFFPPNAFHLIVFPLVLLVISPLCIETKRLSFPTLSTTPPSGDQVTIRARVHNIRAQGAKMVFLQLRQQTETLQGVVAISKEGEEEEGVVSRQMVKWAGGISVGFTLLPFFLVFFYFTDSSFPLSSFQFRPFLG
jgi:hypothetical protein